MNCPKCGSSQHEGSTFCSACGTRLVDSDVTPPQGSQPSPVVVGSATSWIYGTFAARYVGVIVFGALFLGIIVFGLVTTAGSMIPVRFMNFFMTFMPICTAALGIIVVGRAGGFDLSIPGMMPLSAALIAVFAVQGMLGVGVIVALAACVAVGFINGVFSVLLKVPSVFVTLVTLLLTTSAASWILGGRTVALYAESFPVEIFILIFLIALVGSFLLIFFTKLGKPFPHRDGQRRPVVLYILSYAFSAVMACLAGITLTLRLNAATPSLGGGYEYELLLFLFIAGSSTLYDNRVAPVLATVVACAMLSLWQMFLMILGLDSFFQTVGTLILLLLALALDRVYRRNIYPVRPLDKRF